MRRKLLLFLSAALFLSLCQPQLALAQKEKYRNPANDPVAKLNYTKKLRWSDNLFRQGSYYNAIKYYKQLLQEKPRNAYIVYQLAECSWYMRDYVPAAHYYQFAYALAKDIYPEAIYKEALMLKMQGKYPEAVVTFKTFIKNNPKDFRDLKKQAQRDIEGCEKAEVAIKNPVLASVTNLGPNVNSKYTELSPYPLGDTALLFSTMNTDRVIDKGQTRKADYVARFMVSKKFPKFLVGGKADTFQWALPYNDGPFNDPRFNVGNGCLSPGGNRFYFTRCLEDAKHIMKCHIFVSHFVDEKWTEPEEVGYGVNGDDFSSTQPSVGLVSKGGSRKQEVLFFSSNRKIQGRGGFDIWYAVYNTRLKRLRRPQNAGKQINTVRDEVTPFYDSRNGKLYFSSNGWVGMGGFDVYSATGGPSRYTDLRNLGFPINSPADDIYYVVDPIGKPDGYLVSNRIGTMALKNPTCCDDIWRVNYQPHILVSGKVVDEKDGKTLDSVIVRRVDETGAVKTYRTKDGKFQFLLPIGHTFSISGDKKGYLAAKNAEVSTADVKMTDPNDTIDVSVVLAKVPINQEFRINNVLFDFNKSELRPGAQHSLTEMVNLMKANPSLNVEIRTYTDSKGTQNYNEDLSQQRAQAILDFLAANGIDSTRMTAKGMGAADPVAPNQIDGKDNPEGRQQNRRATFKILNTLPTKHLIFDSTLPGTLGEQEKNLEVHHQVQLESDQSVHTESDYGQRGSRVHQN